MGLAVYAFSFSNDRHILLCFSFMARPTQTHAVFKSSRSTNPIRNNVIEFDISCLEAAAAAFTAAIRSEGGSGFDAVWEFMAHSFLA